MLKLSILSFSSLILCLLPSAEGAEIIGGAEVPPHSLPHMALLENPRGEPICGGALIHPRWVVTAAHCNPVKKVVLGVHSISKDNKSDRQTRGIKKMIAHPCYDSADKVNDIMLLKLDKAVKMPTKKTLKATVSPLALANAAKDVAAGVKCMVAGWGLTKRHGKMSDVLRSTNVTVIDNAVCNSEKYYNSNPLITKHMLCAGYVDNQPSDSCQGDSGGPLLCEGVFRGVTSFGKDCGLKTKPGVYTALSQKILQWVKKTIQSTD